MSMEHQEQILKTSLMTTGPHINTLSFLQAYWCIPHISITLSHQQLKFISCLVTFGFLRNSCNWCFLKGQVAFWLLYELVITTVFSAKVPRTPNLYVDPLLTFCKCCLYHCIWYYLEIRIIGLVYNLNIWSATFDAKSITWQWYLVRVFSWWYTIWLISNPSALR